MERLPIGHCFNCGAATKPGAVFCGACGARLEASARSSESSAPAWSARPSENAAASGPALRALSIGEIFDRGFRLTFSNWKKTLGLSAALYLVFFPLHLPQLIQQGYGPQNANAMLAVLSWVGMLFAALIYYPLQSGMLVRLGSSLHLSEPYAWRVAFKEVFPRILLCFLLNLVKMICIGLGFILCVVPGIYLAIRWLTSDQAFFLEGKGIDASLRRSWNLGTDDKQRGLLVALCVMGLGMIVGFSASAPTWILSMIYGPELAMRQTLLLVYNAAIGAALPIALTPLTVSITTVYYYDLLVRQEGFDLLKASTEMR